MGTLARTPQYTPGRLIAALLLTAAVHLLGLALIPTLSHFSAPPSLMKVESISTSELEKMKRILLQNNQAATQEPLEANTLSDRNSKVEREMRAANTDVMPKPGAQARPTQPAPPLSKLGISYAGTEKPRPERTSNKQGAEQNLADKTLPVGERNVLNTQESIHFSFYSRMYERVGPLWQSLVRDVANQVRIPAGDYTTQADIVLDRDGNVVRVDIFTRSGVPGFDRAVVNTWQRLARFPNPPKELIREDGYVHTGWTFTVQMSMSSNGTGVEFLDPERQY